MNEKNYSPVWYILMHNNHLDLLPSVNWYWHLIYLISKPLSLRDEASLFTLIALWAGGNIWELDSNPECLQLKFWNELASHWVGVHCSTCNSWYNPLGNCGAATRSLVLLRCLYLLFYHLQDWCVVISKDPNYVTHWYNYSVTLDI